MESTAKKFDFSELIPSGWCKKPEESEFLLRLYTILPCSNSQLEDRFAGQTVLPEVDGLQVWFGGGQFKASNLTRVGFGSPYSHPETGQIIMPTDVGTVELPLSNYLMMATPFKIDGIALNESEAKSRLNRVEAMLSAFFGSNTAYRKVFEAFYPAKKGGKYSVTSDVFATIQDCDGPTMNKDNWIYFEETMKELEALEDSDKKPRLNRALEFYHSGKSSNDSNVDEKFFFYFTSLQILGAGRGTMETNRQLQVIYGFTQKEVEEKLLWKNIVGARNAFFHQGKKINLHKDAERYMQLLILDILRHELGLRSVSAALSSMARLDLNVFHRSNS